MTATTEMVVRRYRHGTKYQTGPRTFRVEAGVAPENYRADPFDPDTPYQPIDLTIRPDDGDADYSCLTNGYQTRFWNSLGRFKYACTYHRGGKWFGMIPVGLFWVNANRERQPISRPLQTDVIVDNEAAEIRWPDAFGEGLDFSYRLRQDVFFKLLTIRSKDSLPRPTIDTRGLHLALVMSFRWSRGINNTIDFATGVDTELGDEYPLEPDEEKANPPRVGFSDGRPLWFLRKPKWWDSDDRPKTRDSYVETRYIRRGNAIYCALGVAASELQRAVYPVFIDTDISEEVVSSTTDDGYSYNGGCHTTGGAYGYINYLDSNSLGGLVRFQSVPIPQGATINSASIKFYNHSPYRNMRAYWYCEDVDDSATISCPEDLTSSRTKTTANTYWSQNIYYGSYTTSPDLSDEVQEVIDRAGWAENNDLGFIFDDQQSSSRCTVVDNAYSSRPYYGKFNCSYTADVVVTPTAVSAVSASVAPSVVLGSVTVSPTEISAVCSTVDPTIPATSVVVTPNPVTAVGAVVAPTVVFGSLTLTPPDVSAVATSLSPAVILGSLTTSPYAATAVAATVDPSVLLGDITITVDPSSAVAATVDPFVVLGSLTVAPDSVSVVAATVNPAVRLGSLVIAPNSSTALAAAINPSIVLNDITITVESAGCIAATVSPTVVLGSVTITPDASTVIAAADDPAVILGSVVVIPGSVATVASAVDLGAILGSIIVIPAVVTAVTAVADPTLHFSSTVATPVAASAVAATGVPTVVLGAISVVPDPATTFAAAYNPTITIIADMFLTGGVLLVCSLEGIADLGSAIKAEEGEVSATLEGQTIAGAAVTGKAKLEADMQGKARIHECQ